MTRKVFKYHMQLEMKLLPAGKPVLVAEQNGSELPYIWIEHSQECVEPHERYYLIGTGNPIPKGTFHVGSAVCGRFVWHVYKVGDGVCER